MRNLSANEMIFFYPSENLAKFMSQEIAEL